MVDVFNRLWTLSHGLEQIDHLIVRAKQVHNYQPCGRSTCFKVHEAKFVFTDFLSFFVELEKNF